MTAMSDEQGKANLWPWWSAALFLLLALYIGGYFVLSRTPRSGAGGPKVRMFHSQSVCTIYCPLGLLERTIRHVRHERFFLAYLEPGSVNRLKMHSAFKP
jgi:hypothetical protein